MKKNTFDFEKEVMNCLGEIKSRLDSSNTGDVSYSQHLDNYTGAAQIAPEGDNDLMAYKRERVYIGLDDTGEKLYGWIDGMNADERNLKMFRLMYQNRYRIPELSDLACSNLNDPLPKVEPEKPKHELEAYAWEWYDRFKKGKIASTYDQQLRHRLNKMVECSPVQYIEDVTTNAVMDMMNKRVEISRNGTLGKDMMKSFRQTVFEVLRRAVADGYIPEKAIDWKAIPNNGRKTKMRKVISNEDFEDVLRHIPDMEDETEQIVVALLSYTGMRLEEVLGLRCEDIGQVNGNRVLFINRAVVHPGKGYEVKDPKTDASKDWEPVSDELWKYLSKYSGGSGWIVHDADGGPIAKRCRWTRFWKKLNEHIDLHGLRACEFRKQLPTYLLGAKKEDPKTVQRILRHANVNVTLNTYAEADQNAVIAAINSVGK